MIYTKRKAGYHMEKSDILTASLPDANDETADHSTIFDDVFRTIAQKMPQLLIPLINEVFHTSYSEEEHFEQLRNEHYEKYGTVITDSIIRIGNHIYHLECQSSKDKTMVIRMFEYDISIAIEHASYENDEPPRFPGLSRSGREVCGWTKSALPCSNFTGKKVYR